MTTTTILSDNGVSSGSAGIKTTGGNDGTLALQTTTAGGAATTAVTIDTSQNVGIGTASPSVKLDIVGSVAISGEISGAVVATQANQEAGTSTTTIVTPGRQQYHPSAAKFWIMADNAGATQASYNVTSITDVGTGEITVTIANDFSSASYCSLGTALQNTVGVRNIKVKTQSAGSITYTCVGETPAYVDPTNYMLCAFGDQ